MTNLEIAQQREEFISLCRNNIKREGLDELLAYLEKSDFYMAPSSTRFHLNEEGGLCRHSINVFLMAKKIYENCGIKDAIENGQSAFPKSENMEESIAICALFHDLCKIGVYKRAEKFRKDAAGRWETYLTWEMKEDFPIEHGVKSVLNVRNFMKLKKEEMLAIRWHMGLFDAGDNGSGNRRSYYDALDASPLVCLLNSADILASRCLEQTTEE